MRPLTPDMTTFIQAIPFSTFQKKAPADLFQTFQPVADASLALKTSPASIAPLSAASDSTRRTATKSTGHRRRTPGERNDPPQEGDSTSFSFFLRSSGMPPKS